MAVKRRQERSTERGKNLSLEGRESREKGQYREDSIGWSKRREIG